MKSFKQLLNEAAITGKEPDEMALPYSNQLAQHVNVKEKPPGSNRSPEIDRYFDLVGLDNRKKGNNGYPWCAAFVYAMFDDFCKELGLTNPVVKTAGVMKHWNRADSSLKIPIASARNNPSSVKPGQVFIQKRDGGGHTGIVTSVDIDKGTFKTIEGNTNDKLSGEGHRVGRNTRKLSQGSLIGFIDYFKGNRNRKFEETVSKVVANAPTDFSPTESQDGLSINQIKDVQRFLLSKGYDLGAYGPNKDGVDGDNGIKTKTALRDWKSKNGMTPDDTLNKEVFNEILEIELKKAEQPVKKTSSVEKQVPAKATSDIKSKVSKGGPRVLPDILPSKSINIDNFNISKDSNLEIKRAIVESTNTAKSFSEILNEKISLKELRRKLKDIKKSSDTSLANKYRGVSNSSPIENPSVLKSEDPKVKQANILTVKPEFLIIHNKETNKFYVKADNDEAVELIGSKEPVELGEKDVSQISDMFSAGMSKMPGKAPSKVEFSKNTAPTFLGQPVVPSSDSQKTSKGVAIATKLVNDIGLSKEQAAGIVGNLQAESGLVPDRIQGSGMKRGLLSQAGSGGYGWAQYTHHSYKTDLINFAKDRGTDLNTQPLTDELNYEYLKYWISKKSSKLAALKSTLDVRSATDYFLKQYERPADQSETALNKRLSYANDVYKSMG